jgi:hypothetical protein
MPSTTTTIPSTSTAPTATTARDYNGHNTFFADNLYWEIYYDGANMVCRTSPDASTWSSPVTIFTQGADGIRDYFYDKGSNTLYYVRANSGETGFHYRYGTLSSSGCGSIGWLIPETTQATVYPDTKYMGNIVLDSSGDMVVSLSTYDSTLGHWHLEVWKHLSTGWVNINNLDVGTTEYGDILLPLTNSKLALLYSYQPVDYAYGQVYITEYDGTSSWTSPTLTTSSYDGEFSSALSINDTVYFSGDDSLNPHNIKFWMCAYPCASAPPESIIFTSPTTNQDYQTNMASNNKSEIIINYATVKKGSSMDTISYVVSTDGGKTFGPPIVQVSGENLIWNGFGSFDLVGNDQVCLMYTTGTASPYTIKYTCESDYLAWLKP